MDNFEIIDIHKKTYNPNSTYIIIYIKTNDSKLTKKDFFKMYMKKYKEISLVEIYPDEAFSNSMLIYKNELCFYIIMHNNCIHNTHIQSIQYQRFIS